MKMKKRGAEWSETRARKWLSVANARQRSLLPRWWTPSWTTLRSLVHHFYYCRPHFHISYLHFWTDRKSANLWVIRPLCAQPCDAVRYIHAYRTFRCFCNDNLSPRSNIDKNCRQKIIHLPSSAQLTMIVKTGTIKLNVFETLEN